MSESMSIAPYSRKKRLQNQIKSVLTNPYNIIVLISLILLTYLIVVPLFDMISSTFVLAQRDQRMVDGAAGDLHSLLEQTLQVNWEGNSCSNHF